MQTIPTQPRTISTIAREIRKLWPSVHFTAKPYLDAMMNLSTFNDHFGLDPAREIVLYFLSNASSWRGPDARRIKAELNAMLKS